MSRSRRKTPVCGITTARSEKQDKIEWNRRHRHVGKIAVNIGKEPIPLKVVSAAYGAKDGSQWFNPESHPELMRK